MRHIYLATNVSAVMLRSAFRKQCRRLQCYGSGARYDSHNHHRQRLAAAVGEVRQGLGTTSRSSNSRHHATSSSSTKPNEDVSELPAAAALSLLAASLLLGSNVNASCEPKVNPSTSACTNDKDVTSRCNLHWVKDSQTTKAECTVHRINEDVLHRSASIDGTTFDPKRSRYFDVKLVSKNVTDPSENDPSVSIRDARNDTLLHNTIVVLPNLMSSEECELLVNEAEKILREKESNNICGCKTESWTIYSSFDDECQEIMDRVLGRDVLSFICQRLPQVATRLFSTSFSDMSHVRGIRKDRRDSAKDVMGYYWDDPVIIKYDAGNELAPHEDMRELTIVVPLNPLGDYPMVGGGTRFWVEGISPACADSDGGVSLMPSAGTGILFNGDITHSGNAVEAGTRFVLMTSIALDDQADNDEEDEKDV